MDVVGLLAAACVLATFCMQSMTALRIFAIASNVLFIVYGAGSRLMPIVLLHAILLPVNGWSLGTLYGNRSLALKLSLTSACVGALLVFVFLGTELYALRSDVFAAVTTRLPSK